MKLVRHFLATTIAVGLVIGLGFLWSHSGAAGIVADGGGRDRPAAGPPARDRGFDRKGSGGPSLSNIDDLAQTLVTLGLIVGVVVVIDRKRRQRRRTRVAPTAPAA